MVSHRGEIGKIGSQDASDFGEKPIGIIGVVKIALVQNHLGPFGLHKIKHRDETGAIGGVTDKCDFQVGRRCGGSLQARVEEENNGQGQASPFEGGQGFPPPRGNSTEISVF